MVNPSPGNGAVILNTRFKNGTRLKGRCSDTAMCAFPHFQLAGSLLYCALRYSSALSIACCDACAQFSILSVLGESHQGLFGFDSCSSKAFLKWRLPSLLEEAKKLERERIIHSVIYSLDEDGHTGDWKIKFANDYYLKYCQRDL